MHNADNKAQSFKLWPKPFIKSFTSPSGSSLQWIKNLKIGKLKFTS